MLTPDEYEALVTLMHMILSNVVKDEQSRNLCKMALDITLLGCYNVVITPEGEPDTCTDVEVLVA